MEPRSVLSYFVDNKEACFYLRELGFKEVEQALYQQAEEWLFEKYGWYIIVDGDPLVEFSFTICDIEGEEVFSNGKMYENPVVCRIIATKHLIKILYDTQEKDK